MSLTLCVWPIVIGCLSSLIGCFTTSLRVDSAVRATSTRTFAPCPQDQRNMLRYRLNSLLPSHTIGSYLRSTSRSFIGISALSVILIFSGQTSVQHLVMLQ